MDALSYVFVIGQAMPLSRDVTEAASFCFKLEDQMDSLEFREGKTLSKRLKGLVIVLSIVAPFRAAPILWGLRLFNITARVTVTLWAIVCILMIVNGGPKKSFGQQSPKNANLAQSNNPKGSQKNDFTYADLTKAFESQLEYHRKHRALWASYQNGDANAYEKRAQYNKSFFGKKNYEIRYWLGQLIKNQGSDYWHISFKFQDYELNFDPTQKNRSNVIEGLDSGMSILFSGRVFQDEERGIKEQSFSKKGSMELPEYTVDFNFIVPNPFPRILKKTSAIMSMVESKEKESRDAQQQKIAEQKKSNPAPFLRRAILRALGEDSKLTKMTIDSGEVYVKIEISFVSEQFIEQQIRDAISMPLQSIHNERIEFKKMVFDLYSTVTDSYGNSSNVTAMNISYSYDDLSKINWNNFIAVDIIDIGYLKQVHPSLVKYFEKYLLKGQ